ncbi:MAG: glycosyltransferase family 4 protein [Candidatus Stahlbacteria bacterium]|nr:glycosyltransferase family 4 protein [Candidatus Stahlbacteria bacterium]
MIVGNGTDKPRLQSLANELNLNDYVLFTGEIPDIEIVQLYVACELFIMPSKEVKEGKKLKIEGFGIVYVEAGACGKAVIAGKSGGTAEALIDGVTGLLIDTDEKSISNAIIKLLKDDGLRKKMGMAGRQRVVEEMGAEKIANKIDEILRSSIKSTR